MEQSQKQKSMNWKLFLLFKQAFHFCSVIMKQLLRTSILRANTKDASGRTNENQSSLEYFF